MEAAAAHLDLAVVLVGLADLVLVAAAGHVGSERFVGDERLRLLVFGHLCFPLRPVPRRLCRAGGGVGAFGWAACGSAPWPSASRLRWPVICACAYMGQAENARSHKKYAPTMVLRLRKPKNQGLG